MPPYQTHFHRTFLLLFAIAFAFALPYTTAQPSPSPDNDYGSPIPTNAIIIVVVVISFGLLTCCARQFIACCTTYVFGPTQDGRNANHTTGQSRRRETPRGLDPSIIAAFPTFLFSDVKVHLISNKTPLECAICLNGFVDHDHLRLLPRCSHVFHPHCISPWLVSNITCPVCRANLEIQVDGQNNSPTSLAQVLLQPYEDELLGTMSSEQVSYPTRGDDDVIVHVGSSPEVILKSPITDTISNGVGERRGFFPRSHSTGRSLVEDCDKYTLRLSNEVRNKLVNLNNLSGPPNAIVSPRTGYRSRRSNSCATILGKPDQWLFTMSPPFISRSGSSRIAECSNSNSNSDNNNNNNLEVIKRGPRSLFKSMKSPKKSALNHIGWCDDIGERSSDRLWSNPTPQEVELEHN